MPPRRRVNFELFVQRCLGDPDLKEPYIAFMRQANAEINSRLVGSFHHRRAEHSKTSVMHACEVALRLACKDKHVVVPNLALSSLMGFALRRPRVFKGGTLAH